MKMRVCYGLRVEFKVINFACLAHDKQIVGRGVLTGGYAGIEPVSMCTIYMCVCVCVCIYIYIYIYIHIYDGLWLLNL